MTETPVDLTKPVTQLGNNVVDLFGAPVRQDVTPGVVLAEASRQDLKHVVVLGMTRDQNFYIGSNDELPLSLMTWLHFCYGMALTALMKDDEKKNGVTK